MKRRSFLKGLATGAAAFALTPNYHVFEMHLPHMGAQSVRSEFFAAPIAYSRNNQPSTLVRLAGAASLNGKTLTLTGSNFDVKSPLRFRFAPASVTRLQMTLA